MSKSKTSSLSLKSSHTKEKDTTDICVDLNIGDANNIELQITSIEHPSTSKSEKLGGKGVIALSRINKKQSKIETGRPVVDSVAVATTANMSSIEKMIPTTNHILKK